MFFKPKIIIYIVTFLGYFYSGYGSGLLGNLRDAVITAENIFGNVLENVVSFTKEFKNIHETVNDAAEEKCIFECPGGVKPVKNKYYKPIPNGCGNKGNPLAQYLTLEELVSCCNEHDICYGTCNKNKETCDFDFQTCLYKMCEKLDAKSANSQVLNTLEKGCKMAAKTFFTSTLTFGCKLYKDAQKDACYCAPVKKRKYAATDEL